MQPSPLTLVGWGVAGFRNHRRGPLSVGLLATVARLLSAMSEVDRK